MPKDNEINILEQIEINFKLDEVDRFGHSSNLFWDWFCTDESLHRRGKSLAKKYLAVHEANAKAKYPWYDPQKCYLFFKNNCPAWTEGTYDDFRICDIETGDVIFTITPRSPRYDDEETAVKDDYWGYRHHAKKIYRSEVWSKFNNFNGPMVEGYWPDVVKFFLKGMEHPDPKAIAKRLLENPNV